MFSESRLSNTPTTNQQQRPWENSKFQPLELGDRSVKCENDLLRHGAVASSVIRTKKRLVTRSSEASLTYLTHMAACIEKIVTRSTSGYFEGGRQRHAANLRQSLQELANKCHSWKRRIATPGGMEEPLLQDEERKAEMHFYCSDQQPPCSHTSAQQPCRCKSLEQLPSCSQPSAQQQSGCESSALQPSCSQSGTQQPSCSQSSEQQSSSVASSKVSSQEQQKIEIDYFAALESYRDDED